MYKLYPYLVIDSKEFYEARKNSIRFKDGTGIKYKDWKYCLYNYGNETKFPQFYKIQKQYYPLAEGYSPVDKEEFLNFLQEHLDNLKKEVEYIEQKIKQYS